MEAKPGLPGMGMLDRELKRPIEDLQTRCAALLPQPSRHRLPRPRSPRLASHPSTSRPFNLRYPRIFPTHDRHPPSLCSSLCLSGPPTFPARPFVDVQPGSPTTHRGLNEMTNCPPERNETWDAENTRIKSRSEAPRGLSRAPLSVLFPGYSYSVLVCFASRDSFPFSFRSLFRELVQTAPPARAHGCV